MLISEGCRQGQGDGTTGPLLANRAGVILWLLTAIPHWEGRIGP